MSANTLTHVGHKSTPAPGAMSWTRHLSMTATVVAVLLLFVVGGNFIVAAPKVRAVYRDFDSTLPILTIWLLTIPWWVAMAAAVLPAAGVVAVQWRVRNKWVPLVVSLVVVVLTFIVSLIMLLGFFLPMQKLMVAA